MFTAKLEVLGINVPIGLRSYRDAGFLTSFSSEISEDEAFLAKGGMTQRGREVCIFYRRRDSSDEENAIRAHEETHALDAFGKIYLLQKKLRLEQGVIIDFSSIIDSCYGREVKACLGTLYFLEREGICEKLFSKLARTKFEIEAAKEIYDKGKLTIN